MLASTWSLAARRPRWRQQANLARCRRFPRHRDHSSVLRELPCGDLQARERQKTA